MTNSRVASIIALCAAIVSALSGYLEFVPPKYAAAATAICAIITSINERVNGGASNHRKVEKSMRQVSKKAMAKRRRQ